jgi:hypothetical protein
MLKIAAKNKDLTDFAKNTVHMIAYKLKTVIQLYIQVLNGTYMLC